MLLSRPEIDAALSTENVDRLDALVGIWALQLHPIRSTDDLLNFIYCVYVYPASTPHRAERIAADMPSGWTVPAITRLLLDVPLDSIYPMLHQPRAANTIVLVPDVIHCVACELEGESVELSVIRAGRPSHPRVYSESGLLRGELNSLTRNACGARHNMSYAEGGTRIPEGQQPAYAGDMDRSKRRIQLSRDTVFENLLLYRLDRQMVHSHSGLGTFCTEWVSLWNEPAHVVATMRKTLAHCWQARSLLLWLDEIAAAASEPWPCKLLAIAG